MPVRLFPLENQFKRLLYLEKQKTNFMQNNIYMNRKSFFGILGVLCIAASVTMYLMGKNNSHLTELNDFWWMPLPVGAIALLLASRTK